MRLKPSSCISVDRPMLTLPHLVLAPGCKLFLGRLRLVVPVSSPRLESLPDEALVYLHAAKADLPSLAAEAKELGEASLTLVLEVGIGGGGRLEGGGADAKRGLWGLRRCVLGDDGKAGRGEKERIDRF